MYKTRKEALAFADEFLKNYQESDVEVAIIAPYTSLSDLTDRFKGTDIKVGAQNMHYENEGAFTGEISPLMLTELGITYVIIGHSERRQYFKETGKTVNMKLSAAFSNKLRPILCIGENKEERESGNAKTKIKNQLTKALHDISNIEDLVIAYEPIWAIGTGLTATPEDAGSMCAYIRELLIEMYDEDTADKVRILYGGSVKPDNARDLLMQYEIDGALVGGASLKPLDLLEIINF